MGQPQRISISRRVFVVVRWIVVLILAQAVLCSMLCGHVFLGEGLYGAAREGDLAGVERYLRLGVNVNFRFDGGRTVLMAASEGGHAEVVALLLRHGAKPNLEDQSRTAMNMAANERVRQLLRAAGGKRYAETTSQENEN